MGYDLLKYRTDQLRRNGWLQKRWVICASLVALAALFWLASGIGQWQMAQNRPANGTEVTEPSAAVGKQESAYGEILRAIWQQAAAVQLQQIKCVDGGLVIYAAAQDWQEAADFGERLQLLPQAAEVQIVNVEALSQLRDGEVERSVSFTIRLNTKGGAADEG